MDGNAFGGFPVPAAQLEPRLAGLRQIGGRRRAEDDDPREGKIAAHSERFADGGDAQRRRTRVESGAAHIDRSVPVPVRLDDGPQFRIAEQSAQRPHVVADRGEVDGDARTWHRSHCGGQTSTVMPSQAKRMFRPSSCSRCSTRIRSP